MCSRSPQRRPVSWAYLQELYEYAKNGIIFNPFTRHQIEAEIKKKNYYYASNKLIDYKRVGEQSSEKTIDLCISFPKWFLEDVFANCIELGHRADADINIVYENPLTADLLCSFIKEYESKMWDDNVYQPMHGFEYLEMYVDTNDLYNKLKEEHKKVKKELIEARMEFIELEEELSGLKTELSTLKNK